MHTLLQPRKLLVYSLIGLASMLTPASPAGASEKMRENMRDVAKKIAIILEDFEAKEIRFGAVNSLPAFNYGPEIKRLLSEELAKLGITAKLKADYGFVAELRQVNDDKVEMDYKIVNNKNKSVGELSQLFDNFPVTVEPMYEIDVSRVYAKGRKYGVEILVGSKGREAKFKEEMPFVAFEKGEIYEIRLVNNSDYEAAVLLDIDGINIFAFNEDPEPEGAPRKDYRVVVPKNGAVEIKGWYRKNGISNSFQVADYADTAAAQLFRSPGEIGVVTARFSLAWNKGEKPPEGERSSLGTGQGPPVPQGFQRVERVVGGERAVVVIRYDRD